MLKIQTKICVFILCLNVFLNVYAQSELEFSPSIPITLGSGIDLRFLPEAKKQCISFTPKFETTGAQSTEIKIKVIDRYTELVKEVNYGLNYSFASKASWSSYKVSNSWNISHEYEDSLKEKNENLYLIVNAEVDFGRRFASNYALKKDVKEVIKSGNAIGYIKQCGTHTVIGERRKSTVSLVIEISKLNKDTKRIIKNQLQMNSKLGGNIYGVDAEVSDEFKGSWSETINKISRYGTLTASLVSSGGTGITEIENIAPALVYNLDIMMQKISKYSKGFSKENSAISHFILLNNETFGVTISSVNLDSYNSLKSQLELLFRIDGIKESLEEIKKNQLEIFKKYYSPVYAQVKLFRGSLVSNIDNCFSSEKCKVLQEPDFDIYHLNDFIVDEVLVAKCNYVEERTLNKNSTSNKKILTEIVISLDGKIRMPEDIQLSNATIYEIEGNNSRIINKKSSFRLRDEKEDVTDIIGRIASYSTLKANTSYDVNDELVNSINKAKRRVANLSFIFETRLINGTLVQDYIGMPVFEECSPILN